MFYLKGSGQNEKLNREQTAFFQTIKAQLETNDNVLRIAIGNGKACRETENIVSQVIAKRVFAPIEVEYWYRRLFDIRYCSFVFSVSYRRMVRQSIVHRNSPKSNSVILTLIFVVLVNTILLR